LEANETYVGLAFSIAGIEDVEYSGGYIRSQLVDILRRLSGTSERADRLSIGERERSIYSNIKVIQRASEGSRQPHVRRAKGGRGAIGPLAFETIICRDHVRVLVVTPL